MVHCYTLTFDNERTTNYLIKSSLTLGEHLVQMNQIFKLKYFIKNIENVRCGFLMTFIERLSNKMQLYVRVNIQR